MPSCIPCGWPSIWPKSGGAFIQTARRSSRLCRALPQVVHGKVVEQIRHLVCSKELLLLHMKGHAGIEGNKIADITAGVANRELPPAPKAAVSSLWDVIVEGEKQYPPHKVWGRTLVPQHDHRDIHPFSWRHLRHGRWFRFLFGMVSAMGFEHPMSFWKDTPAKSPCSYCKMQHNGSVHGHLARCLSLENPLVEAWVKAWGEMASDMWQWRCQASARDRYLLGKLALPQNL